MFDSRADILPNSVPKETRNVVFRRGIPWVPIYCANCGCDGGWVPEEAKDFAFYLCEPCGEKWAPMAGTMMVPDEVFWEKSKQTQLEAYGRELQPTEIIEVLKNPEHPLTKLCKDRGTTRRI